jgi:hypothetical protein
MALIEVLVTFLAISFETRKVRLRRQPNALKRFSVRLEPPKAHGQLIADSPYVAVFARYGHPAN